MCCSFPPAKVMCSSHVLPISVQSKETDRHPKEFFVNL